MHDFFRQALKTHGSLQSQLMRESELGLYEFCEQYPAAPKVERPEWLKRMIDSSPAVRVQGCVTRGMTANVGR